jgi:hypothetical protein
MALVLAPAAGAKEVTVKTGDVEATLSYTKTEFAYSADRLKITRAGVVLHDEIPDPAACEDIGCSPTVDFEPLAVRDLDGDGEPEVLVNYFTGGAHCCSVLEVFGLNSDVSGYDPRDRNFGNGGYSIEDVDHDGRSEIFTTDDTFAYRFAAYVYSGRPLMILRFENVEFVDVTRKFPRLVRKDGVAYWKQYRRARKEGAEAARGQIAAWAADRYLLGKRSQTLRILKRERSRGHLGKPKSARRFIRVLDQFLRRRGYA